jgi:uncharacterized protein YneF (UPF0154 family)
MNLLKDERVWWRFLFRISLVILLFVTGIYMGLFISNKDLIENNILIRARSHFDNIVLMRRWNALYGGVFVEKKEGVESNPYLSHPDIETVDGKKYTKKNPALMTREISEIINRTGHQDSY